MVDRFPPTPMYDSSIFHISNFNSAGYPLFTMLAILFHRIPLGSPAWRINLLSVVLAASGSFFHFITILRWELWLAFDPSTDGSVAAPARSWPPRVGFGVYAALVGTGLLSFCPLIWMYSIQAEVSYGRGREACRANAGAWKHTPRPRPVSPGANRRAHFRPPAPLLAPSPASARRSSP